MRRTPLFFLLLMSAFVWACDGSSGNDPTDVVEARDFQWPPLADEVGSGALDVPGEEDTDTFVPQCVEAADCTGKFDRPLAKCEQAACNDNLCEIVAKPDGAACDDNDECTVGDSCEEGTCVSGFNTCACRTDEDCVEHEDGNPCNGTLYCNTQSVPYVCEPDPDTIPVCDDDDDTTCLQNQCDPEDGLCKMLPANEGVACDDADPCTSATRCDGEGNCVGNDACDCHEDDDCASFEDSDLCNGTYVCDLSRIPFQCVIDPATIIYCSSAGNTTCSRNRCVPETGICVMTPMPDGTGCEDNSLCTEDDQCLDGVCVPGEAIDCDDDNPCTNDGCNPSTGNCTNVANVGSCDEVHECFVGDYCEESVCKTGSPLNCDDGDVCTVDECVADGDPDTDPCVHTYSEELCPPPE